MSGLSRYEQETIINYNEGDKNAGVYTHNRALRRKLEQLAEERPTECQLKRVSRGGEAVDYIIPKSWVKIRPSRILSEEQRAARAAIIRKAIFSQQDTSVDGVGDGQASGSSIYTRDTVEDEKPTYSPENFGSCGGKEQRAAMAERLKTVKLRQKTPTAQGDFDSPTAEMGKDTPEGAEP